MPIEDIKARLANLNELKGTATEEELRARLQTLETTRSVPYKLVRSFHHSWSHIRAVHLQLLLQSFTQKMK